jgi:hypothetical protein
VAVVSVLREFVTSNILHIISSFRTALFLAAVMVLLEHYTVVLEWLDVFMLRLATTFAMSTAESKRAEVLVFTIQQEPFEKEFQSRSPIDRHELLKYFKELDKIYNPRTFENLRVLAIDYDLSPNGYDLDDKNKCVISNKKELKEQNELDDFLVKQAIRVVLIKPLPVKNRRLCQCKVAWEDEIQKKSTRRILFGHSEVWHYDMLGPVAKYVESEESFPATVFAAAKGRSPSGGGDITSCDDSKSSSLHDPDKKPKRERINFLQAYATGAVKVCQLIDIKGFDDCKKYFEFDTSGKVDASGKPLNSPISTISAIFFGGEYGKDDIYTTPLGILPGVTIQAYTYFSIGQRQNSNAWLWLWLALLLDIILGFIVGLIFHWNWENFHRCRHSNPDKFAPQVGWALLSVLFLLNILVFLVLISSPLLGRGIWINPAPIIIGLFIKSHMAAALATAKEH